MDTPSTVFAEPISPTVALPAQDPTVPYPTKNWPTGNLPTTADAQLEELLDHAFSEDGDDRFGLSLAFVAIHKGRLVAERYGPSADHDHPLISWSMAKSITHALIGVATAEVELDIFAPAEVLEWANGNDPRCVITIDQLLRMVPGTLFNEDYVDEDASHCIEMLFGDGAKDMAAYTAALPLAHEPNTVLNYSSGTTVLLCRILADLFGSGTVFETWMRQVLLGPMGIEAKLTFDEAGTWIGSSFLDCTARDFARFGLLYLRDGVWDGKRILPAGWVDYGRSAQARDEQGRLYGAHWWVRSDDPDTFYAAGYESQRILIDPAADLVLVRLGKTPVELADNVDNWLDDIRQLF